MQHRARHQANAANAGVAARAREENLLREESGDMGTIITAAEARKNALEFAATIEYKRKEYMSDSTASTAAEQINDGFNIHTLIEIQRKLVPVDPIILKESHYATTTKKLLTKKPRSKKKRILKKFWKKYGREVEEPAIIKFSEAGKTYLIVHPDLMRQVRQRIGERARTFTDNEIMKFFVWVAMAQDWLYLAALLGVAFVGALIYDYLRRKSGARKFKR